MAQQIVKGKDDYGNSVRVVEVAQSTHCCGIYELVGLTPYLKAGTIKDILEKAINMGGQLKPAIFLFSDVDSGESYGNRFRKVLQGEGYSVDKFKLGTNPKTGNHIALYFWYTNKNIKESKVMKNESVFGRNPSGRSASPRTGGGASTSGGRRSGPPGFLRSLRRARAGF